MDESIERQATSPACGQIRHIHTFIPERKKTRRGMNIWTE